MKTRGSGYRSDFKKTYVLEKSADPKTPHPGERKQKSGRVKGILNCTKRQRTSETYRSAHLVGRRRASNFVTYTQNGRLFYDIYVRESPYRTNKLVSSVLKETIEDRPTTNLTDQINAKLRRKNARTRSYDDSVQNPCSRTSVIRDSTRTSKSNVRSCGSVKKSAKGLRRIQKCRNKSPDIHKALRRELGPDYVSPVKAYGKRLASLNATAIIGAFNSKSPRKTYVRKKKSDVSFELGLPPTLVHSDEADDAITEPMCSVVDDDLVHCVEITDALTPEQSNVLTTHKSPSCTPANEATPSTFKNVCQINPAIESFHSQRIIPLGHDTFGVQQIMHQVVVMPHSNESSPIMCQSKLPDLGTPVPRPSIGSAVPFPVLSCPKPYDCYFNDTSLQQRHNQVMYNPLYPSLPPQYVNTWNPTLPCISNSSITPSFVACAPPNVILPHVGSPFVVPNLGVTPQVAYPLVLQSFPNIPASYIGPSFPCGIISPVILPTSWAQPSLLPCQPFNASASNNNELLCPMMISSAQIISNTQPQLIQLPSNQSTSLLPQAGLGQLMLNNSTVIPNAYSSSDQMTSSYHSKPHVENHSTCYSYSKINDPVLPYQTPPTDILNETINIVPSPNSHAFCTQTERSLLNESSSLEMKSLVENSGKKLSPAVTCRDNQKDAWVWEGNSFDQHIFHQSDAPPVLCQCYRAIRHRRDGMVIRVKDSVLLCSGPSRSHPPHVAKIVALYHDKNTDTKMMSLLWYYRPEHTSGASHNFVKNELYASRHRDTNPLDCIEDKAYVLPVSAYNRYMAKLKRQQTGYRKMPLSSIVPRSIQCGLHGSNGSNDDFFMDKQLLSECDECFNNVSSQSVFFCRGLYDYKLKRVIKYPVFGNQFILSSHFVNRPKFYGQNFTTPAATLTTKNVTEHNNLDISDDHCCDTSVSLKDDVHKIVNAIEPITSLDESVPFKVCSTSIVSMGENTNTTISPSQLAENDCHFVDNSHMNGECERLSYDDHEGRTSTPVKSRDQYKAVEQSITTVVESQQTLITEDNSNAPPKMYSSTNSCVKVPKPDLLISEIHVTSPNVESQFNLCSSSEKKLSKVTENSIVQPLETNCSSTVVGQLCENKPANHFVCQSDFSPVQHVWPAVTTSVFSCDRSILERSADISVNWGEHGEQIALSLDCRIKENNLNGNSQITSHHTMSSESLGPTQSFIDMTKLPVHPNAMHYSKINSKCLDQDQPRLVIL